MATIIKHKKFNILSNVKSYYKHCYPSDNMGDDINPNINFACLLASICKGEDFYKAIGVSDSLVRERIFSALALLSDLRYCDIYDMWLNSDEL